MDPPPQLPVRASAGGGLRRRGARGLGLAPNGGFGGGYRNCPHVPGAEKGASWGTPTLRSRGRTGDRARRNFNPLAREGEGGEPAELAAVSRGVARAALPQERSPQLTRRGPNG